MLDRIRCTFTYANVMSTIAVFGVLGGGAYAAANVGADDIKRNAVRSKHIKKSQVGRKHLKRDAVSGAKIAKGAVTAAKLSDAAVSGPKLADGAVTGPKVDESTLGIVPNADRVDGVDGAELLRGRGEIRALQGSDAPGGAGSAPFVLAGAGDFTLECRHPASAGSDFTFTNTSGSTANVWTDKVQDSFAIGHQIFYYVLAEGGSASVSVSGPVVAEGRALVKFTIATGDRLTLIEARIIFSGAECSFNAVATEIAT